MAITTLDLLKIEAWLLPRIAKAAKGSGGTDLEPRVSALEALTQTMDNEIDSIDSLIPETASESNQLATMLDLESADNVFLAYPDTTSREALEAAIRDEN